MLSTPLAVYDETTWELICAAVSGAKELLTAVVLVLAITFFRVPYEYIRSFKIYPMPLGPMPLA